VAGLKPDLIVLRVGPSSRMNCPWHEDTVVTRAGCPKSDVADYPYIPEPDLLPVESSLELIEELRAALPEAPSIRGKCLKETWDSQLQLGKQRPFRRAWTRVRPIDFAVDAPEPERLLAMSFDEQPDRSASDVSRTVTLYNELQI
jgi:hypothetical protein